MHDAQHPRLFLIDAMGYIFRAYHAPMARLDYKGKPTQAVYVFTTMLRKLLKEFDPQYIGAVFDVAAPTFRDQIYEGYKANRPEMPEDLSAQLPAIREVCEGLRLPMLEYPGYEADDVIGTLARAAAERGMEVIIVTADKDMLQLVGERVLVYSPTKELVVDRAKVEEIVGVPPERVVDVMALVGDAIDNIPGARGIGEKGARELIQRFDSVEAALENFAHVEKKTYREALRDQRDTILMSKQLATIHTDVPVELSLDRLRRQPEDRERLIELFSGLGFTSLLKEYLPAQEARETRYSLFQTPSELEKHLQGLPREQPLAICLEVVGEEFDAPLGGLALAAEAGEASAANLGCEAGPWLEALKSAVEDVARPKTVHDSKRAFLVLQAAGIRPQGIIHDTMLYSYLLQPTTANHTLDEVAVRHLNQRLSGALAEKADFVGRLAARLRPEIEANELADLYETIERPLAPVLARMEAVGVKIDTPALEAMSADFVAQLDGITRRIYELAGVEFNLNSPKQLAEILFEKLRLPMPSKYGRGKVRSTAADVLEELAARQGGHELPRMILEYRELAKLKSTYIDALPKLIHPKTGRLHSNFNQTGTSTGRLSSSNPNLQNIPIRTELGRRIRAAFVAEPGYRLISADYSQIELRVLAHMSEDPVLVEAFQRGEDIHARTAAEVLGVPPLVQSSEHRRIAKVINFGIIYGLSAFGLAAQLGISQADAQKFIQSYFERYRGVKDYLDRQLNEVRRTGQTRTLFGRLRPIPEIKSRNSNLRGFAERTALNTPLQGTAADLIKLAMIVIDCELAEQTLGTRMILQVHDELLFESPEEEVERVAVLVKRAMEQVYPLRVPLVVDVRVGPNWRDMTPVRR